MHQSYKPNAKKNTLKDSTQQLLLYLNTCSINDKDLFLKKQHADIFLIIKQTNKMYPLISRCIIHNCGLFRTTRGQKCVFFQENFKEEDITNILSLMYGYSVIFDRSRVKDYFEILYKLQFDYIIKVLKNDICSNFQAYDIFILFGIAIKYQLHDILDCCKASLTKQNFQQFRYNLFDLLHCQEEVFRTIINFHNQVQRKKRVIGLPFNQIFEIVQQYCNQNLSSAKSSLLLLELTGTNKPAEPMKTSYIMNYSPIISSIQQQTTSQTEKFLNQKPPTFYSQIIANIEKSVHKTPRKDLDKQQKLACFTKKKLIDHSVSPNLKKRDSQNSDCDSMMKTRLPTQSIILTNKKYSSSKQKGSYKPWQAKKNQQKIVSSPNINNCNIPLYKHMSEQSSIPPRSSQIIQRNQIKNVSLTQEKNIPNKNYLKKHQQPPLPKQNRLASLKQQVNRQQPYSRKQKFVENPVSPIFQKTSGKKIPTKQFMLDPNSITEVSQMEDSNYMEYTQLLSKIQIQSTSEVKSTKKIPKISQKTSIQFLVNKNIRKNSYEMKDMNFEKQQIPSHKKSPILKEIEELNKQCESIQQQNSLLMIEVKSIKSNFARKQIQRKQYKENLIQLDKILQRLQKQFETQNQQLIKISAKIQQQGDRESNSGLLFSSICSSINDHFF